ncbi:LuxS/MPP-like metallohydrolase [Fistulina hepatica ATCC 64428]|uniref:LuxS/MPP-like metallohydrolase n=1 Tax=Fistulina hepatica ATCC 64428 TaxID=1128425 RepID=A0A0D7ADT1_9AGAR|nr:LuxS/MPP-like metallohydrolase [Fistulina hepatica ATCC 64428]
MHKARTLVRGGRKSWPPRQQFHTGSEKPLQITTLPNKIRVATESKPSHFSSLGLFVAGGARFETPAIAGASHFLDHMAYQSTETRSTEEMAKATNSLGGQILCASTRECIMYQSSHFHRATPTAMELIADTTLRPRFTPEELAAQCDAAEYEVREMQAHPEQLLPELLHGLAYNHKGLGNPLFCPPSRIPELNEAILRNAMREWYRPERMVIAGIGMPHERLVELVDRHFSHLQPSEEQAASHVPLGSRRPQCQQQPPSSHILTQPTSAAARTLTRAASYLFPSSPLAASSPPPPASPLHSFGLSRTYTGGAQFIADPNSEFNHMYIAYEGAGLTSDAASIDDATVYALAVMQVLLGGGGSFSAGGPGKGMYSRLYTYVLNQFPQVDHCSSFLHIYEGSSLFGINASYVPAGSGLSSSGGVTPGQVLPHLANQLSLLLYRDVTQVELQRAKNQVKSSMLMAMESLPIAVEDLGRQVLLQDKMPIQDMLDRIDAITAADLRRAAQRTFGPESGAKPTVLAMGHDETGDWQSIFRTYGIAV